MKSRGVWGSPGTGKTTWLMGVCNTYVEAGASVCFVSHTKAAANELTERIGKKHKKSPVTASTIHSLVFGMLGLTRDQVVTTERLVSFGNDIGVKISGEFDITGEQERFIEEGDEAMSIISRADARMRSHMEEYEDSERPLPIGTFEYVSKAYKRWKASNSYIDFNDMLRIFINNPISVNYDVLIVDEAQDLSELQWAVIDELVKNVQWAVIGGDPDQALYVWGGAKIRGMNAFCEKYGAEQHVLPQSYRIPSSVSEGAIKLRNNIKVKDELSYKASDYAGSVN